MEAIIINRSIKEPIRNNISRKERWEEYDKGLITCWETGRKLAIKNPELADRAKRGELPVLNWKGGLKEKIESQKFGSYQYLAQWKGIRGENLEINTNEEVEVTCSRYDQSVTFTADPKKF